MLRYVGDSVLKLQSQRSNIERKSTLLGEYQAKFQAIPTRFQEKFVFGFRFQMKHTG